MKQQQIPEKSDDLLEDLIFQWLVEKGIEYCVNNTNKDTRWIIKVQIRVPTNTETQVRGRAHTFTWMTEMPGLKSERKWYSALISYSLYVFLSMVEMYAVKIIFVNIDYIYIKKRKYRSTLALRSYSIAWFVSTKLKTLTVQNREATSKRIFGYGSWHILLKHEWKTPRKLSWPSPKVHRECANNFIA